MPTLMNRTKQVLVFNIPCRKDCDGKECCCKVVPMRMQDQAKDGTKGVREFDRRIPGSVTFLTGERKEVPTYVAASRDVKRAIDRGALRLL